MKNRWNAAGRIVFSTGILLWTIAYFLEKSSMISHDIFRMMLYTGVSAEVAGLLLTVKTGGFRRNQCRKV